MSVVRDAVNRKITERFIKDNPILVSLKRTPKVPTPGGGWKNGAPEQIDAQTFTLIVQSIQAPQVMTSDGRSVAATHILVGLVDADIEPNDEFTIGDRHYEVIQVTESRKDWAKRAAVLEGGNGRS